MYKGMMKVGEEACQVDRIVESGPKTFSRAVQRGIGQALYAAQCGEEYPSVKRCMALQAGPCLRSWLRTRAEPIGLCTRFGYLMQFIVLHAFQKKSKKGISTPKKEVDMIRQRLVAAERQHNERHN
jgi:phage-related protein